MDKVTAPLPVLPELGKATLDILHVISDCLVGKDTSLPRGHVGRQAFAGKGDGSGQNDPVPTPPP